MYFIDKKKLIILAIGALIISLLVNFPHLINLIYPGRPPMMPEMPPMHGPRLHLRLTSLEFMFFQFLWYYITSFILLYIIGNSCISEREWKIRHQQTLIMIAKVVIVVVVAFVAENIIIKQLMDHFEFRFRPKFDAILFSRYLFMIVISFLTGLLLKMMERENSIKVENEKLRSENLQIQYNALTNQMNPHFFFNSLNSLQYLLIEGEQQKSVIYISELSTVFRYILQSSKKELVPISEELEFLRSYQYLLNIRFEDKIRFDIDIPESEKQWLLPVLSLQPLVENAINHNGCSIQSPLVITLRIRNHVLEVHNNRIPKLRKSSGSGIGLENLNKRFRLLMGKGITIEQNETEFKILLPLK